MHFFTASLIELLFISHYIYYIENITSITRYIFSVGEEIGTEKKKNIFLPYSLFLCETNKMVPKLLGDSAATLSNLL